MFRHSEGGRGSRGLNTRPRKWARSSAAEGSQAAPSSEQSHLGGEARAAEVAGCHFCTGYVAEGSPQPPDPPSPLQDQARMQTADWELLTRTDSASDRGISFKDLVSSLETS